MGGRSAVLDRAPRRAPSGGTNGLVDVGTGVHGRTTATAPDSPSIPRDAWTTSTPAPGIPTPGDAQTFGERVTRLAAGCGAATICGLIVVHVAQRLVTGDATFGSATLVYTLMVSTYVLSRFLLAACYRPPRDAGLLPNVAVIVPAYNEGPAVARTIDAIRDLDYPATALEIVCVDDGSRDDTWGQMRSAASRHPAGTVRCITLGHNQGKRAAMAAGIRATAAEVLVFIDSDSLPAPDAVRHVVQGFADPRVGAIAGLTHVRNHRSNALTKMQSARYFISYQLLKKAESVYGAVACCSGCFAAYRRSVILPVLEEWEHQTWLGMACTYGDDRALTNLVLRQGWLARYDARAEAWTDAPDRYRTFFKQQLRWKKSWTREGPRMLSHLWRTHPVAFPSALAATITGLLSPLIVLLHLVVGPLRLGIAPQVYALGLWLIALAYGLLHRALRDSDLWPYAIVGTFFYILLSFQLFWAIVRIRDASWGTRDA